MRNRAASMLVIFNLVFLAGCSLSPTGPNLDDIVAATLAAIEGSPTTALQDTPPPTATEAASPETPTPSPTATLASPTPMTDAEVIKAALNAYLTNPVDPATITVSEIVGRIARGGIPGAYFLAAKDGATWLIIYAGQATPYCAVINPYSYPTEWVPECLAENGSLVARTGAGGSTLIDALGPPTWTDTMDSAGRWYLVKTSNTTFKIEGGSLVMTQEKTDGFDEWGVAAGNDQTDFYIEATSRTGSACSGLDSYGLIFRVPEPSAGYIFELSCDGRFRLYLWDGDTYTSLQNWKANSAIISGAAKENRFAVMVVGDQVKLYANDKLLGEYTLEQYPQGRFGLVVGSSDTANFKVFIDQVRFWNLAGS